MSNPTETETVPEKALAPAAQLTVAPAKAPINFGDAGVRLTTLEDAFRFSTAVVKSGLAPKGFQTAEAVMIALQHGAEIGLPPMAALQSIAVINGRPGIFGDAALALVRGSGLCAHHGEAETNDATDALFRELQFAMFEGDIQLVKKLQREFSVAQGKMKRDADDFGVTVATARKGGMLEFERFTIGDAKQAGLWGKEGPWRQYPKRMLKFRARGFKLRDTYGDVLKGMRTTEELGDIPPEVNVTPKPSLAALIGAPAQDALPVAQQVGPDETRDTPPSSPATGQQQAPSSSAATATTSATPSSEPAYTAEQRQALLAECEALAVKFNVGDSLILKWAAAQGLRREGQDELAALDTAALAALAKAIPTLKQGAK